MKASAVPHRIIGQLAHFLPFHQYRVSGPPTRDGTLPLFCDDNEETLKDSELFSRMLMIAQASFPYPSHWDEEIANLKIEEAAIEHFQMTYLRDFRLNPMSEHKVMNYRAPVLVVTKGVFVPPLPMLPLTPLLFQHDTIGITADLANISPPAK
jgi:hypothetical protein